ncbi:MCE family protein [Nocardioides sp.]|uniref:MCE family protein n=1 Tax=Nocardioides sp. TaxID=35761 RepID=UPI002601F28A|nr:MCE family protein [Nocardioides sp.]
MKTRTARPRRLTFAVAALAAGLGMTVSGCGVGLDLYNTTLPGGANVGSHPVTLSADFTDAVDLVPQSSVKVDNIAVGRVEKITLNPDSRSAHVTLLVRRDVVLPVGTKARLQQTSLLGEKYVALIRPATSSTTATTAVLQSGANIPIGDTSQIAEVEQVLGALSLVVNGGGIGQLQDISRELQKISDGRPEEIKGFLSNMQVFVSGLNNRKEAITGALDAVAKLSTTLDKDKSKITTALEGLSPGMKVLVDQRTQLVAMLKALDQLSTVSVKTLKASQQDMVEDMKLLEPILRKLADSGEALPNSLELLLTYPFPDSVLGAIKGDYFNVFATANYTSLPASCTGFGCAWPQMEDTGNNPVQDHSCAARGDCPAPGAAVTRKPVGELSSSASASSGSSSGTTAPGATKPSASGGSASGTASASTSGSPSPSLLPPTDSALPGVPEKSVQVPTSSASAETKEP